MNQSKVKRNEQIAQKHSHSFNANGIIWKVNRWLWQSHHHFNETESKWNGSIRTKSKNKREKICVVYVCNVNLWVCVFREEKKSTTIYFITFNSYNFTILLVCDSIRFKENKKGIFLSRWFREVKLWWRIIIIIMIKCVNNKTRTEAF